MDDLAAVFAAHHAGAVRLATLLTGSADQGEDVVGEVFVKLARSRPALENPGAYLRRAITNEVTSSWRRRSRERERLLRQAGEEPLEPDAAERRAPGAGVSGPCRAAASAR